MKLAKEQRWAVAKALAHPEYAREMSSSEELHALMLSWNWDWGIVELNTILDHPACDKGTALSIYFVGAAGYYRQFLSREQVPDIHLSNYDLIIKAKRLLELDCFGNSKEIKYHIVRRLE